MDEDYRKVPQAERRAFKRFWADIETDLTFHPDKDLDVKELCEAAFALGYEIGKERFRKIVLCKV